MRLATISDLGQDPASKGLLIERAMQLGKWYGEFKRSDNESRSPIIRIGGTRERAPGIHASEISRCLRLLVYSIADTERRPPDAAVTDVNMQMRFEVGHAVHALVQDDFARMCQRFDGALTFEPEVKISPELGGYAAAYNMNSSCDGRFTFWYDRVPYLRVGLEIKTKSGPEYDKVTRPDDEHAEQTCFYQRALDLPLMWIFYYNKSNSNWTSSEPPYFFQFDSHLWNTKLEPRFVLAHQMAASRQLPPREEGRHCRWCPFAWTCQPPTLRQQQTYGPSATAHKPGALRIR